VGHLSFATRASSRLERSRQWGALTHVEQVEIDDDRESSMRAVDLGDLRLCLVSMGKHRVGQRSAGLGETPAPTLKFIFQEEGTARIRQHSGTIELRAGQWCGLRKDEPYAIEAPDHSRQLAFTLACWHLKDPRKALQPWHEAQSFRRGAGHILHAAASASVVSAGRLVDADARLLGANLIALLEIALRSNHAFEIGDLREERRRSALDFIERHLADPDLDVASIAHALGCSSRTIHKLFEGETLTVAREIWDRRLERCRLELVDPAMARRSITEIAHDWGFSDSQHFSRAFKHRFGSTPREYRAFAFN
jgi:AraC-like DNA-binding protein